MYIVLLWYLFFKKKNLLINSVVFVFVLVFLDFEDDFEAGK